MRKRLLALLALTACIGLLTVSFGHSADTAPNQPGKRIPNFTLIDPRNGNQVSLTDFKDRKAVVVVFVGTECPLSNLFVPHLAELHREFAHRGVQFLAINSNVQDTPEKMVAHARKFVLPFPLLKDERSHVADQFGAQRLCEAFVLDETSSIRYHGRIDDQYGIGFQRPKPVHRDLAYALDALLAGKEIAQPVTAVAGCRISRAIGPRTEGTVTFAREVSRILQKNCQECHRPGQIGPFSLLTYDDARDWAATIREVVQEERMPPWYADPRFGKFDNDRRLPPEDRAQLLCWLDQGCPRGDDSDLPPPRPFTQGWVIGKPDAILSMPKEFDVPATAPKGGVPYQYFTVDTGFTEDRWVVAAEAKADATEVVHHILVFIVAPGEKFFPDRPGNVVLCGQAPGDTTLRLPPGAAKKVPAGSRFVFQMHYTPNGRAQKDRSSVGLIFSKDPPRMEARTLSVLNPLFRIPAGADNYQVESRFTFKEDAQVLGFMPHMHLRGKDFLYEAILPDGKRETLLFVPRFSFGWQSSYRLAKPLQAPKGTVIHCVAHFDNSAKNPNNPDPTATVSWGEQTWEEMMIGWMEYATERKGK